MDRYKITIFMTLLVLGTAFSSVALSPTIAQANPIWTSRGAEDAEINGFDFGWCDGGDASFFIASTTSGYRTYDGEAWQDFEEPGVPGRETLAGAASLAGCSAILTARVDAAGHGYIERSVEGSPGTVVYASATGAFFAIDSSTELAHVWACSRAGDEPGELITSSNAGATWEVMEGHGLVDPLAMRARHYAVLVADASRVVVTLDDGATWEDITTNLPPGEIRFLWDQPDDPFDYPDGKQRQYGTFYVCTDSGLYSTYYPELDWQPVLSEPCRYASVTTPYHYPTVVAALTDEGRILHSVGGYWNWEDVTGEMEDLEILQLIATKNQFWAVTRHSGVFSTSARIPGATDVPNAPSRLVLQAAPNPFNPVTTLRYEAPRDGHAVLAVHDLAGRRVATLLDGPVVAGPGSVTWRPQGLASGIYLARLVVGRETARQKLVLLK